MTARGLPPITLALLLASTALAQAQEEVVPGRERAPQQLPAVRQKVQVQEQTPKHYFLRIYVRQRGDDGKPETLSCPSLCVLKDSKAQCFCGQDGIQPRNCVPVADLMPIESGVRLTACVQEPKAGELRLALAVEATEAKKIHNDNIVVAGHMLRAVRKVKLDRRQKIVIATDRRGRAQYWVEVVVSDRIVPVDPALVPDDPAGPPAPANKSTP